MKKFYEKVCKLEELIALILVAGIAVLVFVSALMRTIGHPLNWAQDVALIAFAWLIFLGSDVAMRGSGLIGVDLFVKKFPAGVQKVLDILFKVIIAAFLCVLIYYGYGMTTSGWARQITSLHISYSWVTMAVPVGSFFMLISTIRNIIGARQDACWSGSQTRSREGRRLMFIAIGIFFVFLLLGMPVAFSIGLSGFSFFMIRDLPMTVLVQKSISTSQSFTMLAIPLFILAGNLMNSCGITKRLMRFANACTGHMYGNIGQVSCLMSTLMGGVSGSAVADASMECRILGPEMTRLGYDRGWSAAINGLSGLIVATIPPSMGLIIYGTVGEVSIGRLFMAGWVPGVLMCVLLMLAVTWSARRFGYKPEHDHPAPLSEILKALLDSIWAILFPVLLIVLIRFGIMSPTESGSFACAYALLVGTVFYHELTWESLLQTLRDSVKDITVITIILAFSGVFGYGIVFDNITVTIANALLGITSNSAILLLLVVVFLLICGMFMETTVIALILTPILLPVMRSIGVNEVVFGMIMMTTVTFGVMTPPVGTALYAVSDIMECPIEETFKKGWPFYLAIVCVILFMIFFPQAVLFLPNLVYGA